MWVVDGYLVQLVLFLDESFVSSSAPWFSARGFGRFSCFSMVLCMECMICWNDSAVVLDGWVASVWVIVVLMSSRMVALFFWYLYVESIFVCFCFCLGGAVW